MVNLIQCNICNDILTPIDGTGIKTCYCGNISIYPPEHNKIEVKENGTGKKGARVIKIFNPFLKYGSKGSISNFTYYNKKHRDVASDIINSLFAKEDSNIVLAEVGTPGTEWTESFSGWKIIEKEFPDVDKRCDGHLLEMNRIGAEHNNKSEVLMQDNVYKTERRIRMLRRKIDDEYNAIIPIWCPL